MMQWNGDDATLRECVGADVRMSAPPTAAQITALAGVGAASIAISLHGARREVHDWYAPGTYDATLTALGTARSCGLPVTILTTLVRSNARVLAELPSLLKARGVSKWILTLARAEGATFTATVPRIALGVPPMLAAVERARAIGIDVRLDGFPHCALGPFAALAIPSAPRSYAAGCDPCDARARCPGVDAPYLERFGDRELRPLDGGARTRARKA